MNYKIAVCDDSDTDRKYVQALVEQWADAAGHTVIISAFSSAESFLFQYADSSDFDMLLLDIEMGEMDGVTMAKGLRRSNDAVQIVFITGYSDYISEGYEVSALHYLMKPVSANKLFAVLDRAAEKLRKTERMLTLDASGETVRVPISKIRYAQVHGNYVTVHAKEEYVVKMTLGELFGKLDESFYRVGRSAIVNLDFISRVTKTDIVLKDGSVIQLPRGAYDGVNRAIIERM